MSVETLAVVIPTMNNGATIEPHIAALEQILLYSNEIIVVDSSTDNTLDLCKKLLPQRTRYIKHPPGLYASWNAAIKSVDSTFTYFSTIGDTIEASFLKRMLDIMDHDLLDLLISPPKFIGAKSGYAWPIHKYIEAMNIKDLTIFNQTEAALLNFNSLSKYGLSSLSGSFASNLVRSQVLKDNLFPLEYGGFGDAIWFAKVCGKIRLGLLPECGSKFLVHPSAHKGFSHDDLHRCWQEAMSFPLSHLKDTGFSNITDYAEKFHACKMGLKKLRRKYPRFYEKPYIKARSSITKKLLYSQLEKEQIKIEQKLTQLLKT